MTSEAEAFLTAICAHPNDDLPRLVYADYLEEHDQPERARFIRLQCELAHLTEDHPDWMRLVREEKRLREQFEPSWSIPGLRGVQHFNRGFVEVIQTSAEWLLQSHSSEFRFVPLRELRLVTMDRYVDEIVQLELLDRVEILTLNNNSLGSRGRLELLLESRPLTRLQRLELRNCLIWPDGVATLVNSAQARRLMTLDLSGNPINDAGVEHLCRAPLQQLRHLIIRGDELDQRECLHPRAAEVIADEVSQLKQLRTLDWSDQYIGDAGLRHLARSRNFFNCEQLLLPYNEIGEEGAGAVQSFLDSPHWPALQLVDWQGNRFESWSDLERESVPRQRPGLTQLGWPWVSDEGLE